MNILYRCLKEKKHIVFILLLIMPASAFCKSNFKAAYQVDDQIISNYDIDQARKLHSLLRSSDLGWLEVEQIVINEKIKEIYANRLQIIVTEEELTLQLNNFLKSNKLNSKELKSLMNSQGVDIETFYNYVKANIMWQKVMDTRFGYKINNLAMKDVVPLAPTPKRIEKEYQFSEILIPYKKWGAQNANLLAKRLEIELKAGADFEKAVEKFSAAESKKDKGKVGPIQKSRIPKDIRDILDNLKKDEISTPFEVNGGVLLLRLNRTRSYRTVKTPNLSVTFSVSSASSNSSNQCSEEAEIRGPVSLSKVDKNIKDILTKLMPGESYKFSDGNGLIQTVTLCESFISEKEGGGLSFENIKKNEEALRLSNALMLELRRNTTIVKK